MAVMEQHLTMQPILTALELNKFQEKFKNLYEIKIS